MTDDRKPTHADEKTHTARADGQIDRRRFFRGAAALAAGALGAPAALAQVDAASGGQPTPSADAARELETQTAHALRWGGRDPANWVRARAGVDHNVVILGGGHSGTAIGYGLRRKGIPVEIIDQAEPGQAGIWRNIARMHQLRTPKTMPGPEMGNVALSFRAWFETLNGPGAFDALDRIPRLTWADYLTWFRKTTDTQIRYRTRLLDVEPQGDVLRLRLESDGQQRVETTRKLVLANGYAGAGGPNIPGFVRALPKELWTHTTGHIPLEALKGKTVAVVGAGSNAFDAAGVTLEAGAAEVHMFNRRPYIEYQGQLPSATPRPPAPPVDRGYPGVIELTYELPDAMRWRNFLLGEKRVASVPLDSMERAVAFKNFHIHLSTSLEDVHAAGNKVVAKAGRKTMRFDYLISATGYRIDLAAQPELAKIYSTIALWGDRYRPAAGEENAAGAAHPYLGAGFEFLPREGADAPYLRNIHCFNLAAELSFGIPVGDVPSMACHPRLVTAIARDLFVDSVDAAAHERYIDMPLTPSDPAPYQRAVEGDARAVA
jgi:cation diffusion facilitator CzcD-associated flavoprotein CzcO